MFPHFTVSKYATTSCIALSVRRSSSSTCEASGSVFTIFIAGVRVQER